MIRLLLLTGLLALGFMMACVMSLYSTGCASARREKPPAESQELTSPAAARGELLFLENCNLCHPGGETGVGPNLKDQKFLPAFLIRRQVRWGFGDMPAFSRKEIPGKDLDAIVAYLKALRQNQVLPKAD